jgi:DNA-directed RNA polymerase specialized sigma24 family protein
MSRTGDRRETFPKTRWGLIGAAAVRGGVHADGDEALSELLARYLPVLQRHLVKRFRVAEEQADEWLQDFVCKKLLEGNLLAKADPHRGRFRNLLVRALENYVLQAVRLDRTASKTLTAGVSLEDLAALGAAPVEDSSATELDRIWAHEVLAESLRRMQLQCEEARRPDVWGIFDARVVRPLFHHESPEPYRQIVGRLNLNSSVQAANLLGTAKRMFSRIVRGVVADYCRCDSEVTEELGLLSTLLSSGMIDTVCPLGG